MYKITADLTPYSSPASDLHTPRTGRRQLKMARTPESSARLSSVLDQLSNLSHQLNLEIGKEATPHKHTISITIKEEDEKIEKENLLPSSTGDANALKSKLKADLIHLQRFHVNSSLRRKAFSNCENIQK